MAADGELASAIIMLQPGVRPQRKSDGLLLMAEIQPGDDGNVQPGANEIDHGFQRVARVIVIGGSAAKAAQHNRGLTRKNTGMIKLQ